jgi:glycerate 2-kinase
MIENLENLIENGATYFNRKSRADILKALDYSMSSSDAYKVTKKAIQELALDKYPIYLVSLGKAAISMANAAIGQLNVIDGVVVSNRPCGDTAIKCIESTHPIPSIKSKRSAKAILNLLKRLNQRDTVLFLISGGASSLVELPSVPLKSLIEVNDVLIKSGLSINEINCIRKHLSTIKGGKITAKTKAKIVSLVVSDVVGDDLSTVASGITYFDNTTFDNAVDIINRYKLEEKLPKNVLDFLAEKPKKYETIKEKDFNIDRIENFVISNNTQVCLLAKRYLEKRGYRVVYIGSGITQDINEAAEFIFRTIVKSKNKTAIISGGEPTVNVKGGGIGGRNLHLALLMAKKIKSEKIVFASFATDGKDGNSPSAGAIVDSYTKKRASLLGLDIDEYLNSYNSFEFFKKLQDYIISNDTKTNLADIHIAIYEP